MYRAVPAQVDLPAMEHDILRLWDEEDVFTRSRSEMLALIQIAMGGQVAEELFFGDISTGPGGDLSYATTVAAQMVGAAGMGGSLVSLAAVQQGALADSNLVGRVLADREGRAAVEAILSDQKQVVLNAAYLPSRRGNEKDLLLHFPDEDISKLMATLKAKGLEVEERDR